MKVLVTGSSGFLGTSFCSFLKKQGCQVLRLVRTPSNDPSSILWTSSQAPPPELEGVDAVVHLAGENIGQGMWTANKKKRILESRQKGTESLVRWIGQLKSPPRVFLSASAVGYYGSSISPVAETSLPGKGFLAEVCILWEKAADPLRMLGVRVVHARLGAVLSPQGGILKVLAPIFQRGLGAIIGDGTQILSWIALDDAVRAFWHLLNVDSIQGAVNVVSPFPVSQKMFASMLAQSFARRCFLKIPRFFLRGEKAREMLLSSIEAVPFRLQQTGFSFLFPTLQSAFDLFYFKRASSNF